MSKFHAEMKIKEGYNQLELPKDLFRYIKGFGVLSLKNGKQITLNSGSNEVGLVIFNGQCDIVFEENEFKSLGSRKNVFDGMPTGVYIPIDTEYNIFSHGVTIAVCRAKCEQQTEVAVIKPDDVKIMQVGRENWKREVRMIIGENSPSVNLLVGETINPPGNWSGTPPHKHEKVSPPTESLNEELYYFKTDKPNGYGIEKFYSPERNIDELIPIKDNTVTYMPWGYHQIVAGPGYTLYYLFFLAGEGKNLIGFVDPNHKWINEEEEQK